MAYSSIVKPTDYFNTKLYTGNGSTQALTGVGFQPDWVWIKNRTEDYEHTIFDSVRGVQKFIRSSTTGAEATNSNSLTAFGTDGFSIGTESAVNDNSDSFVSWNWLASGSTASNSNGSITSTVSANTTAGFSIVSYTGTATSGVTIGHGLGVKPNFIILKNREPDTASWPVYHSSLGATKFLSLNLTNASSTSSTRWNNTEPTTSVFTLGSSGDVVGDSSGETFIAYCFAEKKGYSKFGSYTGNGNADGTFVYTGFKPAWVLHKRTDSTSEWFMFDNKRLGYNPDNYRIMANLSDTEADPGGYDLLSNGFKLRFTSGNANGSGNSYIFMAFAENPFVANDSGTAVPVVAR
jgi:hypothetical protein